MLIPKTETGNVGLVCKDCAAQRKKDTNAMAHEPEYFIGKHCLLPFAIRVPAKSGQPNKARTERMWVYVVGPGLTDGKELCGTLANDPVYATEFAFGDIIEFSRSEIQAIEG